MTLWYGGTSDITTFKLGCYADRTMEHFAVMTADGTILATDDHLAALLALYPVTYRLAELGFTRYGDG